MLKCYRITMRKGHVLPSGLLVEEVETRSYRVVFDIVANVLGVRRPLTSRNFGRKGGKKIELISADREELKVLLRGRRCRITASHSARH